MKHEGVNTHRLLFNPMEKAFADRWQQYNDDWDLLEKILYKEGSCYALSQERDIIVAATVIQWLGTPVGQDFLTAVLASQGCAIVCKPDKKGAG